MAKKIRIKGRKAKARKFTRFPISPRTEMLLASAGILVLILVSVLSLAYFAPRIWKRDVRMTPAEKAAATERARQWERSVREGIVVREDKDEEIIFVDRARWSTLAFRDQDHTAAAAADRFRSARCFVKDAGDGSQIGLYTRNAGYKSKEPEQNR